MISLLRRRVSTLSHHYTLSPAVKKALNNKKGVVALESTVITHGLPYPNNIETARLLEEDVRNGGCEPATIALLDGKIHVGLNDAELKRVAEVNDAVKVSTRDIATALVKKSIGGTTVAATMRLAHTAGIKVFATGGIGGVHRGADESFDISADLVELSRTPVTVVCAGVKSILDIAKTVEYLETHSVQTIVFGQTNIFPGFFTSKTESKGQLNTEDIETVANIIEMSRSLGLASGTVLACPIPKEFETDGEKIEVAIHRALQEAQTKKVRSQQITPFLLKRVNELTKGASMKTNIALLRNNAKIASRLASVTATRGYCTSACAVPKRKPKVVVVGAMILDYEAITNQDVKDDGGSYVGQVTQRCGGVARNHADALSRLGCDAVMLSAVGCDAHSDFLLDKGKHINLSRVLRVEGIPTAVYMSMNVKGSVRYGVSSIEEIISRISPEMIKRNEDVIASADFVVMDGNIPTNAMDTLVGICRGNKVKVWFEPTDIAKMCKMFDCDRQDHIQVLSPNAQEFRQLVNKHGLNINASTLNSTKEVAHFLEKNQQLMHSTELFVVTLSTNGTVVVQRNHDGSQEVVCLPAAPCSSEEVVSVSGAGDSWNSGVLSSLLHGLPLHKALQVGQACASVTLATTDAVAEDITYRLIAEQLSIN